MGSVSIRPARSGTPMSETSAACGFAAVGDPATVDLDRGAFACALSRGPEPQLFVVGQHWGGPGAIGGATGQVVTLLAPAPGTGPGAGYP